MNRYVIGLLGSVALLGIFGTATGTSAQEPTQERRFFSREPREPTDQTRDSAAPAPTTILRCTGPVARVMDLADEGVRTTSAVFGTNPGGGEGRQFDKTPLLSTKLNLTKETCLDAHLSAIVGSRQTYGRSPLTLFQVTLTPATGGGLRHIVGHYETPYGIPSPAVALEAERDVDMFAANFFQRVGSGPHEVPPGTYTLDVWWAGAPPGAQGGAIGAAFVLKLYMR
jgi:hypothetical protein